MDFCFVHFFGRFFRILVGFVCVFDSFFWSVFFRIFVGFVCVFNNFFGGFCLKQVDQRDQEFFFPRYGFLFCSFFFEF
jgi:hypothetical protein